MKHAVKVRKFGRSKSQREALVSGLAVALIEKKRIITTEARAKSLRPFIEKLLTRAKNPTLANVRIITSRLMGNKDATHELVHTIAPLSRERVGGYTSIIKMPQRGGDASPMAVIRFVDSENN